MTVRHLPGETFGCIDETAGYFVSRTDWAGVSCTVEDAMDSQRRRDALLKEYGEVATNFRTLTDIRFRLLALLPIAAAAAAWLRGDALGTGVTGLALSIFGLTATIGLVLYNVRNDQLYDELVGRAASIERSLGLADGAFANRPSAWLNIHVLGVEVTVNHGTGVAVIYAASVALWLGGLFAPLLEYARSAYLALSLPYLVVADPTTWVKASAIALAAVTTVVVTLSINAQINERKKEMRRLAAEAVEEVLASHTDLRSAKQGDHLIRLCAKLSNTTIDGVLRSARFYSSIDSDSLGQYVLPSRSREHSASCVVALLTHLPQRWIFECYSTKSNSGSQPTAAGATLGRRG